MNANELADKLMSSLTMEYDCDKYMEQAATMLRQQQALIEILNGRIERMIEKQSHYESMEHAAGFETGRELGMKQERERNNEPVAWFEQDPDMKSIWYQSEQDNPNAIPLYTYPVKEQDESFDRTASHMAGEYVSYPVKEPTDLELLKMIGEKFTRFGFEGDYVVEDSELIDFARAILRKAQE
jgi:hypothetical protein